MSNSVSRRGFMAFAGAAIAAIALTLAFVPNAFAATLQSYDLYTESTGDFDQHVVLKLNYDENAQVVVDENADLMDGLTIEIAGYDVTSDSYYRPVTAEADGNTLVLNIGNVTTYDEQGNPVGAFTAQYGGVIDVEGVPGGVTVGGQAAPAIDIYTVIPTGVHISMDEDTEGTNNLSAVVDGDANVRGMVHIALYDSSTGSWVPVNSSSTAGNLGVGTYTTHAHNFMALTTADYAANIAAFSLPAGYAITANGSNLQVTGPAGSQLHLYVFDDDMLQGLGWTFSGVVSNDGVMDGYLPGEA